MTIEIDDPETVRVVRELARRLNVAPEEAVRRASEAALEGKSVPKVDEAAIDAILRRFDELPLVDIRTADEILEEQFEDGLR